MGKKGIALAAAVMLIVFASIAILGVTVFIIQRLHQAQTNAVLTKCIYLAQAGVQNALYWFRFHDLSANGYFSSGQVNIDAANFFVTGGSAADLLMINTGNTSVGPTTGPLGQRYLRLLGLILQNAVNSNPLIIDRMVVTWNTGGRLREIVIFGSSVWTGNKVSPADCNINNFTLNTVPTVYNNNYLRFNSDMRSADISINFIMTDSSSKSVAVYPASNNYNFTVKSTGKTADSDIYRTISADYNALTGKITGYNEIDAQITP